MQYLGAVSKMRMISVHCQDKPFNITVIHVYAPTSNAEDEFERFYEELQDPLELSTPPPTPTKKSPFHYR